MEPNHGIKTWQWVVTVVVIIVIIVVAILVFGGKNGAPVVVGTSTEVSPSPTDVNRIVMVDQYPGNVVYLSSVQLANSGWVVIHEDNSGTPGNIIGYTYFDKGINPGKVTLTKPLVDGHTYYAMLHSDDGNKRFNATLDLPLKDTNGNTIMVVFHASTSAGSEIKG